jgi:hypothetical protein
MQAPMLEGARFSGEPIAVTNDGQGKVIVFLAHWCPHCQAELPRTVAWLGANQLPANVVVYGVATGTSEDRPNYPPQDWLDREGWHQPTLVDDAIGTAAEAMGLSSYPFFVAVNTRGQVVARMSGEIGNEQFARLVTLASD